MPAVLGNTQQQARIAIENAGLDVGRLEMQHSDRPAGQVIAGNDRFDSTSMQSGVPDLLLEQPGSLEGVVVGVPEEYFPHTLDTRIARLCREALRRLEAERAAADAVAGLVGDLADALDPALLDRLGDGLGEVVRVDLVGQLGDDEDRAAAGVFLDLAEFGLPHEPTVQASIRAGIDRDTY